jgi:formylglycine-generating enzyme required for sulfatase activity
MLNLDGERRQHYRVANRTAEAAFLLDSRRRDLRDLLATVLFERTLIAERNRNLGARDDLYQRLLLFDADGTFRRRWEAPGHLAIDSGPRGAVVTLTPLDGDFRLLPGQARSLGRTPLPERPLPPGAYLLTLSAPGRVETRLPIVLGRDEHLALSVPLPRTDAVPVGFIYVPPGRFLFGSDADDGQRRDFFYHVPLHESATGPYLIAQHETTYGDWLPFLRDLPPAERRARTPGASEEGMTGWLALRQQPDGGFLLITQPGRREFRVREGERIVYPGRPPGPHREVEWLRMPVTGISTEDALAYLAWLDRTRRVPGARLCTEKEWERAARGADSRVFPHGDRLQPSDANYDQTYGQEPLAMGLDEVGSHPASRSLFGVDDLTGNAFEWVENSVSDKRFALRGGAYYFGTRTDRIDNRQEAEPSVRNPTVGMRVCATIALGP